MSVKLVSDSGREYVLTEQDLMIIKNALHGTSFPWSGYPDKARAIASKLHEIINKLDRDE
jgi:hypothetical protein